MKKSTEEVLMIAGGLALILYIKGKASAATPTGTPGDITGGVYAGANSLPTPGGSSATPSDPTGGVYGGANYGGDPTGGVYASGTPAYGQGPPGGVTDPSTLSGYFYDQRRRRR
jgi:hypothetical protein